MGAAETCVIWRQSVGIRGEDECAVRATDAIFARKEDKVSRARDVICRSSRWTGGDGGIRNAPLR